MNPSVTENSRWDEILEFFLTRARNFRYISSNPIGRSHFGLLSVWEIHIIPKNFSPGQNFFSRISSYLLWRWWMAFTSFFFINLAINERTSPGTFFRVNFSPGQNFFSRISSYLLWKMMDGLYLLLFYRLGAKWEDFPRDFLGTNNIPPPQQYRIGSR